MNKNILHCESCRKQITKKEDANILAFLGFVPKAFCNNCYSAKERGFMRHFVYIPRAPLNSKIYFAGLMVLSFIIAPTWILVTLFTETTFFVRSFIIIFMIFFIALGWTLYFVAKNKLSFLK